MTSWMIGHNGLAALIAIDESLAAAFFDTPVSFIIDEAPPAGWHTTVVKAFSSFASYQADTSKHPWVLHDPEKWSHTPVTEQQHARDYLVKFADLAHVRGAKVIQAPARDLCRVTGGDFYGGNVDATYLRKRVASACYLADVYHCQAQADQANPAAYKTLVTRAHKQIPPCQPMWAGLTTMRKGNTTTQLLNCYKIAMDAGVQGFWLNVGVACMVAEFLAAI